MSKKKHWWLAGAMAVFAGIGAVAGDRLYRQVVLPKARSEEEPDFSEAVTEGRQFVRNHPAHQDVYLKSIDQLKLHAVYLRAEKPAADGHRYAVLVHGIHDNCESMGIYARQYADLGVHVLLPDLRGYGKSEGNYTGFGYDDRLDIIEWIYWLLRQDEKAQILLHGVSMGAATVLMTAGEHLPDAVKGVISDSAYSDLKDEFAHVYASSEKSLLPFPIAYELLRVQTRTRAGFDLNDVCPQEAVARADVPILYLHGDADRLIPVSMATKLYEETGSRRHLATFMGADHIRGVVTDPEKYREQVLDFCRETAFL